MRRLVLPIALFLALTAAPAPARVARSCHSADLRYPYTAGGPKTFGVFRLQITGGTCATAHRVAKDWMTRFEANLRRGSEKLPRSVDGFTVTDLPATQAQTYRLRARRHTTSIRFDYRVPNG